MEKNIKNGIKFNYSDAWLLLSIIYAKSNGIANLVNIIGYGDFINHAIFTIEELKGGFYRLINSDYIVEKNGEYIPTSKIMLLYNKFTKKRNLVNKELEFIRFQINSPDWSKNYNPHKLNKNQNYKNINEEIYKNAYKKYKEKIE